MDEHGTGAELAERGFLVVGGTAGVGLGVVLLASRAGARAAFCGPPGGDAAAGVLPATSPAGASFVPADLSSPSGVEFLFDEALTWLGELNVLVVDLTQAPAGWDAPLHQASLADWNHCLALRVRLPFLLAQRAVEEFLFGGEGGRIVFVAAGSKCAADVVSLEALKGLTRSIAKEYGGRRIACNAVAVPRARGHELIDAAVQSVSFLASARASFVTGEVLAAG